jgi:hypothetical protein
LPPRQFRWTFAGRFLFFSDASEIAAENSAGMSHMLHKKLVAKKTNAKENKRKQGRA